MSQRKPTQVEIERFAKAIVLDGKTQADAFRAAFPSSKSNPHTAQNVALGLSKLPEVRQRIEELKQEAKEESQRHFGATLQWKTQKLMEIIDLGMRAKFDQAGNETPTNLQASCTAIAELNRMAGDHAPTRSELTGKNGAPLSPTKVEWTITPVTPPSHES